MGIFSAVYVINNRVHSLNKIYRRILGSIITYIGLLLFKRDSDDFLDDLGNKLNDNSVPKISGYNIRKTSKTMGTIEAKHNGKNLFLRVDAEPDANKIQIQNGKGKNSLVNIKLDSIEDKGITYTDLEDLIPGYIRITESQKVKLFKFINKAFKYLE